MTYGDRLRGMKDIPFAKETVYFDAIDSTNERAKADLRVGRADGNVLYVADMQTAGKGRTGRGFLSPAGTSIYMSLTVKEELSPEAFPMLTIVAAVAVSNALDKVCGVNSFIKWPNDILIADSAGVYKKIVGILTEAVGTAAVIGIGINVNNHEFPPELKKAGSLFTVTGREHDRAKIIKEILAGFEQLIPELVRTGNLSFIRALYDDKLISRGRQVVTVPLEATLSSGDTSSYAGDSKQAYTCIGIDDSGSLRLMDENGKEFPVNSGEVSLRGVNGYI